MINVNLDAASDRLAKFADSFAGETGGEESREERLEGYSREFADLLAGGVCSVAFQEMFDRAGGFRDTEGLADLVQDIHANEDGRYGDGGGLALLVSQIYCEHLARETAAYINEKCPDGESAESLQWCLHQVGVKSAAEFSQVCEYRQWGKEFLVESGAFSPEAAAEAAAGIYPVNLDRLEQGIRGIRDLTEAMSGAGAGSD